VARQPVAGDRRRVALSLTPAGLAIFEAGHAEMLRVLTEQLSALPAEECAVVEQAFGILRAHFRHRHPELERDGA